MKKSTGLFLVAVFSLFFTQTVKAEDIEFHSMKATAYCLQGQTASGEFTREGICASKREWIGKIAAIYINDNGTVGDFLGYYDILDTGGEAIKKGYVIDIWLPTKEECKQFGNQDVLVSVIDGEQYASKQQDNDTQIADSN